MIRNLENMADEDDYKRPEEKPAEILARNIERNRDPITIVNHAISKYGDSLASTGCVGHGRRHNFAILALLCDYFEYGNSARFGSEFQNYYERHLKGTATPKDSVRNILKKHFLNEGIQYS